MDKGMDFDFAVIGAGMAGASMAYELSSRGASVVVLEAEAHAAYHTTGRSAAFYMVGYGNSTVRAVTVASKTFYDHPPEGFCDHPLLKPLGALYIAKSSQQAQLQQVYQGVSSLLEGVALVDAPFVLEKVPQLRKSYVDAGFWEPSAKEIDVAALLQGYIKLAKRQHTQFVFNARVNSLCKKGDVWTISTDSGEFTAKKIVNAAGAWADKLAKLAGAKPVGLIPKKRTVCVAQPEVAIDVSSWPLTIDIDERFYFKPENGNILITPADETPVEPMDAFPDELDVAIGIERFQEAMDVKIKRVVRQWAGLRSFVDDKSPVVGFDSFVPGFFWLAGQGGYGIQMAPALAKIAASLALGGAIPQALIELGVDASLIGPQRYQSLIPQPDDCPVSDS